MILSIPVSGSASQRPYAGSGGQPEGGHPPAHRILVSDGETRSALSIVRSLGRSGANEIHVCSPRGRSLAGASRYARQDHAVGDPLRQPASFARQVAAIARRLSATVVIPVSEAALLAVLAVPELFDGMLIPFVSEEVFRRVSNKALVLDAARSLDIATPAQRDLATRGELEEVLDRGQLRFPLVIKPARSVSYGSGGGSKVGVRYAANERELIDAVAQYRDEAFPLLLQQRIVGPGTGVFLLRWDGETVAAFSHRRLREKPPSGGVSVYSESVPLDAALLARSEALLEHFDWRGVAMIEYKLDAATGTPYLMEINGRFWGSLQLAISAGVDFPSLLIAAAMGERPTPRRTYRLGVRNRWWWGDVDHVLARLRHSDEALGLPPGSPGRARAVLDFLRWRATDHNEIFAWSDPGPFLHETRRWL